MARSDDVYWGRGSYRDGPLKTTVLRTLPVAPARSSRATKLWLARHGGIVMMAAAAVFTIAMSLGKTTPGSRVRPSFTAGHQSLYASPGKRSGVSVAKKGAGRLLQVEAVGKPLVEYETQLQLFMCNPSAVVEGNDAFRVDEESLVSALALVNGLGQSDVDDIVVTIKTGPSGDDDAYMCDAVGMLQWHAQIRYSGEDASFVQDATPAVLAARANDYVAYSSNAFKTILTSNLNDEFASSAEPLDMSAADIVVPTVGWTVTFPPDSSSQETHTEGNPVGLVEAVTGEAEMWGWWVWLAYGILVACCLVPLCCLTGRRRRHDKEGEAVQAVETTRKERRQAEGLEKIRGPEWGITDLDFEADHTSYQRKEMQKEYHGAGKGVKPTAYRAAHQAGKPSAGGQAWMQEGGRRSEWAQPASRRPQGGNSPPVRRFDIDDDDADDSVARLRGKHPRYSFDTRATGAGRGGPGRGGGERKR